MKSPVATPMDVKLMNMTAVVLFGVFAVLSVAAAVHCVARLPVFGIRAIAVSGDVNHNNAVTLKANVAARLHGTFFTVDLDSVRGAFEAVPWVRHAVVRRVFPHALMVSLQEHQAAAYWGGSDAVRLLNSYGEIFEANVDEVDQDKLPTLNGPEEQSAEVLAMYRTLAPLFAALELNVDGVQLSGRGSWQIHLDSGAVIELGRGGADEVLARVQRFLKTLTQVVTQYERRVAALESADLRHENGYAIRLRGVSTVVAEGPKR